MLWLCTLILGERGGELTKLHSRLHSQLEHGKQVAGQEDMRHLFLVFVIYAYDSGSKTDISLVLTSMV